MKEGEKLFLTVILAFSVLEWSWKEVEKFHWVVGIFLCGTTVKTRFSDFPKCDVNAKPRAFFGRFDWSDLSGTRAKLIKLLTRSPMMMRLPNLNVDGHLESIRDWRSS